MLLARYMPGAGSLPTTLVRAHLNGIDALQKRLRRRLQQKYVEVYLTAYDSVSEARTSVDRYLDLRIKVESWKHKSLSEGPRAQPRHKFKSTPRGVGGVDGVDLKLRTEAYSPRSSRLPIEYVVVSWRRNRAARLAGRP